MQPFHLGAALEVSRHSYNIDKLARSPVGIDAGRARGLAGFFNIHLSKNTASHLGDARGHWACGRSVTLL